MFVTFENHDTLERTISMANDVNLINSVAEKIINTDKFDMCDCSPPMLSIAYKEQFKSRQVAVRIYYPSWRWSKALGYFDKSQPDVININGYKIQSLYSWQLVSLMHHEFCHSIMQFSSCNCHHGSNNPNGKENTFQYSVNRFVREFYNIKPRKYVPWYKRLWRWIF